MEHLSRQELGEASASFTRAIQAFPALHPALRGLADIDLRRGQYDRAEEWIGKAIQLQPRKAEYYSLLALIHIQAERNQEALTAARQALALDPQSADANYLLGLGHERLHQPEKAIDFYKRTIALQPSFAAAHFLLGSLYSRDMATFRQAAESFEKALSLGLDRPDLRKSLGSVLVKLEEYEEAVEVLERAVQDSPEDSQLYYHLSTVYRRLGRPAEAASALQKYDTLSARERERRDAAAKARAYYNTGIKHFLKGDLERAYDSLSRAVESQWYMDRALHRLAWIDLERGNRERAAQWIRRAIAVKPEKAEYHFLLARALESTDKTGSTQAVRRALELDSAVAEYHNFLGNLLVSNGASRDAVAAYRNAVAMAPSDPLFHLNLSTALTRVGQVAEAEKEKQLFHELSVRAESPETDRQ